MASGDRCICSVGVEADGSSVFGSGVFGFVVGGSDMELEMTVPMTLNAVVINDGMR